MQTMAMMNQQAEEDFDRRVCWSFLRSFAEKTKIRKGGGHIKSDKSNQIKSNQTKIRKG